MALRLEDYAFIGDTQAGALVGRNGSIDWLCLPRFDSSACFAALLGKPENGRWILAPKDEARIERRYRNCSLVLETTFRTGGGTARVVDCMPPRQQNPDVVRVVEGVEGTVAMHTELVMRFDYGSVMPWVRKLSHTALHAVAGPDALVLRSRVPLKGEHFLHEADFEVHAGERIPFVLTWHPSHERPPKAIDALFAVQDTDDWWREWCGKCTYQGPWREAVMTSLVVLKALTYAPTGGIVAAPTTSLPEWPGSVRNWDYRFCWLRDATLTLLALMLAGYKEEAQAWRDWLLRSVAGDPSKLQIMYGVAGERRIAEYDVKWLSGYDHSTPVRVGNAAVSQLQLDVYGEVMDALHHARAAGLQPNAEAWRVQQALLEFLEGAWSKPDEGIWEVRGDPQDFTHSKMMAWVAFDRAVKTCERFKLDGPHERWRKLRDQIHREVCERSWSPKKKAFTQAYGSDELDASVLLMPQVGFLPAADPRVASTVDAIARELSHGGFISRYETGRGRPIDGLPPGEGAFLACTFWLADAYALMGRTEEAKATFERLLSLRNDVGLLSEEYDPQSKRLLGNFPQAFSHVGVVNTAFNLTPEQPTPASDRQAR